MGCYKKMIIMICSRTKKKDENYFFLMNIFFLLRHFHFQKRCLMNILRKYSKHLVNLLGRYLTILKIQWR